MLSPADSAQIAFIVAESALYNADVYRELPDEELVPLVDTLNQAFDRVSADQQIVELIAGTGLISASQETYGITSKLKETTVVHLTQNRAARRPPDDGANSHATKT